jgi:hypothetical protein
MVRSTNEVLQRSAHCKAGGHKQCRGRRLGMLEGRSWNTLVPCECGCHNGDGTREIDRLRAENTFLKERIKRLEEANGA